MKTILILEDNIVQLDALAATLENNLEHIHILKASDYETALLLLEKHHIHFFLLDIELNHDNPDAPTGIDLGMQIRSIPKYQLSPILFITSIPDKTLDAINKTHCYNYILKPYTSETLLEAVTSLFKIPLSEAAPITLRDSNGIYYKISEKNILYAEASGKKIILHMFKTNHTDISKLTTNQYRLAELCQIFSDNFIQCHKKYIVNANYISSYDKSTCLIHIKSDILPVGRKYKQNFERMYIKI